METKAIRRIIRLACLVAASTAVGAQSPVPSLGSTGPAFEVASIRRSSPDATFRRPGTAFPGGRWLSVNATLLAVVRRAYPDYARPGLIIGAPGWMSSERFDIDARAGRDVTRPRVLLMLRQLLADRFKLEVHTEPRQIDVYVLIVARRDGRLGPGLKPASQECLASLEASRAGAERPEAVDGIAFNSTGPLPCNGKLELRNGLTHFRGALPMASLADSLQAWMDRRIVDRTGLEGVYEFDLELGPPAPLAGVEIAADSGGRSTFTSLREQLGLKLERRRDTVDVLVIDSVERPTPN